MTIAAIITAATPRRPPRRRKASNSRDRRSCSSSVTGTAFFLYDCRLRREHAVGHDAGKGDAGKITVIVGDDHPM